VAAVRRDQLLPGTLDLLILKTLARGAPLHGFEIVASIEETSNDVFSVEEGSLYPALQRMLVKGWVAAKWGATAEGRRARYYRLTAGGRKQLQAEVAHFGVVVGAITRIIQAT
jgi:PadR family transcriptional regulator PadR